MNILSPIPLDVQPTDVHQRLAGLAGEWSGEETMLPSAWEPEARTLPARISARLGLGGFGVVLDYEQGEEDAVAFEEWSPMMEGKYHRAR